MKTVKALSALLIVFPGLLGASGFAFVQKGSPLQIVGATGDLDLKEAYSHVFVVNVSTKTILRAQFGWTMADGDNKRTLGVGYGPPVDLNLPPLEIAQAGAQGATFSILTEKSPGVQHVQLILGVVYVKFLDGSEWKYSMEENKGFDQIDDPALLQKITPKLHEFREKSGLLGAARACPTRPELAHHGLLAWLANVFSIQTVHAQPPIPWFFVCSPSPRSCYNLGNQCTTLLCEPGNCSFSQCCFLNGITGQLYCGN